MKVSYNWLKDYCDSELPAHELAQRMSHAGLNVDSFEPRGPDWVLDVEVKSNRPDCLSHIGIAREIAALTGKQAGVPAIELHEDESRRFADLASVEVESPDLCPHYTARVVTGVKVAPSPRWLADRLEACGLRPVNNVVDITNYVMYECGQPLHAFDLSRIGGNHIVVRRASHGESITTIDGTRIGLGGDECVIADHTRPIALAGVMGGVESEIGEATTDVLLESARFDPVNNRRTSRRHGISSDSSYRYQRGIDPEITDWASRRACALILELAGGTLLSGSADLRADSTPEPTVTLRMSRLALVLGVPVPKDDVLRTFCGLGLEVIGQDDDAIAVRIPSWRADLSREVDLIEEVARIHGYDRVLETTQMPVRPVLARADDLAERRARRVLAGAGFCEVMTYSLIAPDALQTASPWTSLGPVGVRNPISAERTHLRVTNTANLLAAKRYNQAHGSPAVDLFELGNVFVPAEDSPRPEEKLCLAVLTDRQDGLQVLKGVLANLCDELGIEPEIAELPADRPPFAQGLAVELRLGRERLGVAGVVSAEAAAGLDLRSLPAVMEVDFGLLVSACRFDVPCRPLPQYPGTQRDVAIVVDEHVLWAHIRDCVEANAPDILESVEFFDIYRGKPVPKGRKSVAFTLTFRRNNATITAEDADAGYGTILDALRARLGAELR